MTSWGQRDPDDHDDPDDNEDPDDPDDPYDPDDSDDHSGTALGPLFLLFFSLGFLLSERTSVVSPVIFFNEKPSVLHQARILTLNFNFDF